MPTPRWQTLNERISRERLRWRDIEVEFLDLLAELDELRRKDRIPGGRYRQKGNFFRDTVIALVKARCGFELREREIPGKTDVHRVDLSYLQDADDPTRGFVLLAGEAKAMGSPQHERGGRRYPERPLTIDIDKRIKEVKYTSIDLKRRFDPQVSKGWAEFIGRIPPAFFTAWLMRLSTRDRLEHILEKLVGVTEYTNGVGVALYQERESKYEWITNIPKQLLTIEELAEKICRHLSSSSENIS